MPITLPIIMGLAAFVATTWAWIAARKARSLRARLELSAVRHAELAQRNHQLREQMAEYILRQAQDAERRSAAVSKGNRTRAAKRAARIAAMANAPVERA